LGVPDAAVAEYEDALVERLVAELSGPLLLPTWRQDRHPDHEATGRAAARAAAERSARLVEYPIWAEHRGRLRTHWPSNVTRLRLSAPTRAAKVAAVHAFRSQLEPSPDGRPVVPRQLVEHVCAADEVLFG
jgi:LmbE family N-acetylglucosaminyl deacetylase